MTAVQISFRYDGKIRLDLLARIQESHRDYGVRSLRIDDARRVITVEYDATRLDEKGVEAVLRRMRIPVVEMLSETT